MSDKLEASSIRVSSLLAQSADAGETNGTCHDFTGGVQPNNKHVVRNPKVLLVLWDHYYRTNPDAISFAQKLVTDLITGKFMNGLAQYGVARGALIKTIIIDTNDIAAPDTWDAGGTSDRDQIKSWVKDGTLSPAPSVNEADLLYFLLLPQATTLTNGKNDDGTPNTNVCGWHQSSKVIDSQSAEDDLFWGLVRTDGADRTTEKTFINSIAFCVSHELNEAFSNRDQQGFKSESCEIGDICETKPFYVYNTDWTVEQYWSQWDNNCINGDGPVSIKKFLKAIGFNSRNGLRSLGTPVINIQFIASKM
jgi:hypothetical protein